MADDIEEFQKEKLRLEIEALKRPFFRLPTFWLGFASAVVAIVGVFAQSYLSRIEKARAELLTEKANKELKDIEARRDLTRKETEDLRNTVTALRGEVETLETTKRNLTGRTESLVAAVAAAPPSTVDNSVKAAAKSAENSLFSVALYGFEVAPPAFDMAKNYLTDNGYTLIRAQMLSSRPPWLAERSTVLYYDDKSENVARTLAEELTKRTGRQFEYAKGSGLGVPQGQEERNFRIHFVG
jgi:hypothetical protein